MPHRMPAASKIDGDQIRGRRLAVGAGDADHLHLAARDRDRTPRRARASASRASSTIAHGTWTPSGAACSDTIAAAPRSIAWRANDVPSACWPLSATKTCPGVTRARVVRDAGHRADRGLRAQRIVGPDQTASVQRAVELSPGHGRLAVAPWRGGRRSRTRRQSASPSIGAPGCRRLRDDEAVAGDARVHAELDELADRVARAQAAQIGHRAGRAVGDQADDRLAARRRSPARVRAGSSRRATSTGGGGLIDRRRRRDSAASPRRCA